MRAAVTGADGFVGQWLIRYLIEQGCEITGFIRGDKPDLTTLDAERAKLVDWRSFELGHVDAARALLEQSKPDVVFHLAAQSSVRASIENPLVTFEVNVLGTAALLEACRTSAIHTPPRRRRPNTWRCSTRKPGGRVSS
jgi:nucleoside-diphosphate-sugar epimerase